MNRSLALQIPLLTRVEGHAHIVVDVAAGVVETCQLQVVEAPRLFEKILVGRSVFETQHLASRICGICACAHSVASIRAAEAALGFVPSRQTERLRRLLLQLEQLDSHILHAALLALPDLLGASGFVELLPTHGEIVRGALRMKQQCNEACTLLVGRHVHPVAAVVGGFTALPERATLERMCLLLEAVRGGLAPLLDLYAGLTLPAFCRDTEYVALQEQGYPLTGDTVVSSDGEHRAVDDYRKIANEFIVPHATAKHARLNRESYAVGALARYNLHAGQLGDAARAAADRLGLRLGSGNPFDNSLAQLVECVQHCDDALAGLDALLHDGIDTSERVSVTARGNSGVPVRAGRGVGAVEAPRGSLFHCYEVDEKGIITAADCVIPTAQNLANIEADLRQLVLANLDLEEGALVRLLEMLVRAYDPCISCATHVLKLDLKNRID